MSLELQMLLALLVPLAAGAGAYAAIRADLREVMVIAKPARDAAAAAHSRIDAHLQKEQP
jgi:hypothetical protein